MTKSWIIAAILFIYIVAPPGGETYNYMKHEWHEDIMAYCNKYVFMFWVCIDYVSHISQVWNSHDLNITYAKISKIVKYQNVINTFFSCSFVNLKKNANCINHVDRHTQLLALL